MTNRWMRNDSIYVSGSVDEPSGLSDILSATSEEETLTSCTSSLSVVTSWDDTVLGNNTNRTSSYSLREDKFDREASSDVHQMFEAIDCELYGDHFAGMASLSSCATNLFDPRRRRRTSAEDELVDRSTRGGSDRRLHKECIAEWKNTFPHMRICGVSLTGASDEGFEVYPTTVERTLPRTPATTSGDSRTRYNNSGFNGLSITGRNVDMTFTSLAPAERHQRSSSSGEEIFVSDGNLEEIVAIDYRNAEESGQRTRGDLRRTGIPPITPLGCIHNCLIDSVFDVTWQQIVTELRPFLRKHCKLEMNRIDHSLSRLPVNPSYRSPDQHPPRSPPYESSPVRPTYTPEKPPSRQSGRDRPPLTGLLRIHRKALLAREKLDTNLLPAPPHSTSSSSASAASTSNILFVQLPGDSLRITDSLMSPGRPRYGVRDKLEVIHDDDDQVPPVAMTTTFQIRGQGLQGSSKGGIDPLSSLSVLPPITTELNRMTSHLTSSNASGISKLPSRRLSYRVTSALAPKTGRLFPAERPTTIPQSRPVTESGLYHRNETQNPRPNGRRHSATNTFINTSNNNMRNLFKTMIDSSNAQPQVKGIGLQRFHTVIS